VPVRNRLSSTRVTDWPMPNLFMTILPVPGKNQAVESGGLSSRDPPAAGRTGVHASPRGPRAEDEAARRPCPVVAQKIGRVRAAAGFRLKEQVENRCPPEHRAARPSLAAFRPNRIPRDRDNVHDEGSSGRKRSLYVLDLTETRENYP
jgi:hypothetical protein